MRTPFLIVLLFLGLPPARGGTIEAFEVLNSSNPNAIGGVFSTGGGYHGSFSLDVSGIPTNIIGFEIALTSFDIFTTGVYNLEFSSSQSNATGTLVIQPEVSSPDGHGEIQDDQLQFVLSEGLHEFELLMELIEPAGTFHGGVVLDVQEESNIPDNPLPSDNSGSALLIDPTLVPEPSGGMLMAAGLALFTVLVKGRVRGFRLPIG